MVIVLFVGLYVFDMIVMLFLIFEFKGVEFE